MNLRTFYSGHQFANIPPSDQIFQERSAMSGRICSEVYIVIITRAVLPPANQNNVRKTKTKSGKRNISQPRPPFIICAQPLATCNCLKRASSQGVSISVLSLVEVQRDLTLIGPEVHDIAGASNLCHK